jgi:hypothetical protein
MISDNFDLTIPVTSGAGSVGWSDTVSHWIISSISIKPPSAITTYNVLVTDSIGNVLAKEPRLASEAALTGNTTIECNITSNDVITIAISSGSVDGNYAVRVNAKR